MEGTVDRCPCCGAPLDPARKRVDVEFQNPDPVRALSRAERRVRVLGQRPFLAVKDMGCFVRVLLPVHLSDGYEIVFGCWIGVSPDDFAHAHEVWDDPRYGDLVLRGFLANRIEPWSSTFAAPSIARPRESDALPYISESPDPGLAQVINEVWPHSDVLVRYRWLFEPRPGR